ncbi:ORF6N domain-containing protein [Hafnia alvei]|uniref:ORF6N domain-containing protein n=1 Tax=Hafnia alvei TaxID=569 RepID=UPI001867E378|nr:ORF6N domain-containing protein [Hafnia alvei]
MKPIEKRPNGQGLPYAQNQVGNISINDLPVIEWCGARVVTTETLAMGYNTQETNIRTNLSANKARFIEGVHVFTCKGVQLAALRVSNTDAQISSKVRSITLWTERGAARMSKIVDTDEAWEFFEKMEESYFSRGKNTDIATPKFSDPAAAARAWADEYEAKNKAITYVHRQARYIGHLENLFTEGLSPVQFCKRLNGVNTSKVNAFLKSAGWLYDDRQNNHHSRWRVYSYARDKYLTETSHTIAKQDKESFEAHKPILLHKGAVWLYRKYLKGSLPMKKNWDGVFTHDKELEDAKNDDGQ